MAELTLSFLSLWQVVLGTHSGMPVLLYKVPQSTVLRHKHSFDMLGSFSHPSLLSCCGSCPVVQHSHRARESEGEERGREGDRAGEMRWIVFELKQWTLEEVIASQAQSTEATSREGTEVKASSQHAEKMRLLARLLLRLRRREKPEELLQHPSNRRERVARYGCVEVLTSWIYSDTVAAFFSLSERLSISFLSTLTINVHNIYIYIYIYAYLSISSS